MSIIEIEQTLGYLRQSIDKEDTLQLEEAKISLCKAQNIIQKYIEKNYSKTQWKHINLQPSKSFY
jgi:hypothetical protein